MFFIFNRRTWSLVWSAPVCICWNIYTFIKNTTTAHVQDIWLVIIILTRRQRRFILLRLRHPGTLHMDIVTHTQKTEYTAEHTAEQQRVIVGLVEEAGFGLLLFLYWMSAELVWYKTQLGTIPESGGSLTDCPVPTYLQPASRNWEELSSKSVAVESGLIPLCSISLCASCFIGW